MRQCVHTESVIKRTLSLYAGHPCMPLVRYTVYIGTYVEPPVSAQANANTPHM